MAFLVLSGVTVAVAVESVSLRRVGASGEEERSLSGSLEGGPLVIKREWAMATTPVPVSEVEAWAGLIEGKGNSWPFNADLYSSRGRGLYDSEGSATITASSPKHGVARVSFSAGGSLTYATGLTSGWTVMLWRRESSVWRHYLITSAGAKWKDGARNDALVTSTFLVVSDGNLQLGDIGAATGILDFDDMVALPYVVPESWVASMYARHSAAAWDALPRLSPSGTFTSDAVTVRGRVVDSRVIRYAPSGTLTSGHAIQFTLREV